MVKLNKNRSENFLAFVSTRARSGSRPNRLEMQFFFNFCAAHLPARLDIETEFSYFLFLTWLSIIRYQEFRRLYLAQLVNMSMQISAIRIVIRIISKIWLIVPRAEAHLW